MTSRDVASLDAERSRHSTVIELGGHVKEDGVQRFVSEVTEPQAPSWDDIDSEMKYSTREVCLGYGSLSSLEAIHRLRNGSDHDRLPRR